MILLQLPFVSAALLCAAWALVLPSWHALNDVNRPSRRQGGLGHLGYTKSLQNSAAWIFQGDNAWLPALPLSPHAHLVGGFTAAEPAPLPEPFESICDGANGTGLVYVSMGTTGLPGRPLIGPVPCG